MAVFRTSTLRARRHSHRTAHLTAETLGTAEDDLRQADGFTTETIFIPLRVVLSHEAAIRNERIAGKSVATPICHRLIAFAEIKAAQMVKLPFKVITLHPADGTVFSAITSSPRPAAGP